MNADALYAQLAAARKEARLTKATVANRVGVSATAVGMWEGGGSKPSVETLVRWAHSLGREITVTAPGTAGVTAWAHSLPEDVVDAFVAATCPEKP